MAVSIRRIFGRSCPYLSKIPVTPISGEVDEKIAPIAPDASNIMRHSSEFVSTARSSTLVQLFQGHMKLISKQRDFSGPAEGKSHSLATLSPATMPALLNAVAHFATALSNSRKVRCLQSEPPSRQAETAIASGRAARPVHKMFSV